MGSLHYEVAKTDVMEPTVQTMANEPIYGYLGYLFLKHMELETFFKSRNF